MSADCGDPNCELTMCQPTTAAPLPSMGVSPATYMESSYHIYENSSELSCSPEVPEIKIQFEDQGWTISTPFDPNDFWDPISTQGVTQVSHYCPVTKWRSFTHPGVLAVSGMCQECNESVPDSVLTLWKLQNAKYLAEFTELYAAEDYSYIGKIN